ncbi:MAG: hypothetical protein HY866_18445, partial [Chloroflexi bacterium]|nr:hypothetical protein [Chloroflexota bacterium]
MLKRLKHAQFDLGWIAAAVLPLLGILPTLGHGVIDAADGPYHVHRIYAMSLMLRDGQLWPRWIPYFHIGFGYPIFNFYPSGVSYLGGILALVGLSPAAAFNIVAALAWIIGGLGMYALAREVFQNAAHAHRQQPKKGWRSWFTPIPPPPFPRSAEKGGANPLTEAESPDSASSAPAAILAVMLWAYAPSRFHEVWTQGGLAQMMSAALVPWLCYGLIVAARRPSRRALLGIALPLAGIVLTHVPIAFITALITLPAAVMIPAWITRREPREFPRRFGVVIAGLALGAALAAIFVLPMALELRYIRAADDDPETIAFLSSRFVQLSELFAQPRPVDLTDLTFQQPITLGLTGALLGLIGLIALVIRRRFILAALLALLVGLVVFMMLDDSLDVWLNIPYFRQIRFPERL